MGIWQKWLGNWAMWWDSQIKVNLTQVYDHLGHPVLMHTFKYEVHVGWIACRLDMEKQAALLSAAHSANFSVTRLHLIQPPQ